MIEENDYVQVSPDGRTVWVHADDGSTVGRFSKSFGMDVHTTAEDQMNGKSQCLKCTHETPGKEEWDLFCNLMQTHYGTKVDHNLMTFDDSENNFICANPSRKFGPK